MKKKVFFLGFLLVGILSITFAIPIVANGKPSFALDSDDIPGWTLHRDYPLDNWTIAGYSIDGWYQIWIDNTTWASATKCVLIILFEIGFDVGTTYPGYGNLWESLKASIVGHKEVNDTNLDACIAWNVSNRWFALGYKGEYLVLSAGYDSETMPSDFLSAPKTPTIDAASEQDIIDLIKVQASAISTDTDGNGDIPGYNFVPIFFTVVIWMSFLFLLRKDQLRRLKIH